MVEVLFQKDPSVIEDPTLWEHRGDFAVRQPPVDPPLENNVAPEIVRKANQGRDADTIASLGWF